MKDFQQSFYTFKGLVQDQRYQEASTYLADDFTFCHPQVQFPQQARVVEGVPPGKQEYPRH